MYVIYHDRNCILSHACLNILRIVGTKYRKVKSFKEHFTAKTIEEIIEQTSIKPMDLVNTKNKDWKCLYQDIDFTEEEIIQLLSENHNLMKRPIIVSGNKAIIGRPAKTLIDHLGEPKQNLDYTTASI